MQATTSGVIPNKNEVYSKEVVSDFLNYQESVINGFLNKSCLYQEKSIISDVVLNYLNQSPSNSIDETLKNLILNEFNKIESMYPYLGDYFIGRFFDLDKKPLKRKSFVFSKDYEKVLTKNIKDVNVRNITDWIVNNVSLEYNIIVEETEENSIYTDVIDDFIFNFEYDFDFYRNNKNLCVKDYNFIIIDGFLETVSEIHHLMFKANKTKEPYVIFCHGISEEVKYNILRNNAEGRTQILPVSIDYNEETLNILNDLAVVQNSIVVSSKLGQTISQEVRKDLKKGKSITFLENKILLKSATSYNSILTHRKFLKRRISEAMIKEDVNTDVLYNRLKSFSLKSVKVYIPKILNYDKNFSRELDYALRFLSNLDKDLIKINTITRKNYIVPVNMIKNVEKRVNSLKNILYNIEKIIA